MDTNLENTSRFTGRAEHYSRFRPNYPDAVIDLLQAEAGWTPDSAVADIGAGTGISSELFLRRGNRVWAIEPNPEMRAHAEALCRRYPALIVVTGSAEATTLPDACADFVIAATAFHWFNLERCRSEFLRILTARGSTVLMWNRRESHKSPFLQAYEDLLLRFGTDYKERWGKERHDPAGRVTAFFGSAGFRSAAFPNLQNLDREGLIGRILSSSYAPMPGHPNHQPMLEAAADLFDRFEANGQITIEYETAVYFGRPSA